MLCYRVLCYPYISYRTIATNRIRFVYFVPDSQTSSSVWMVKISLTRSQCVADTFDTWPHESTIISRSGYLNHSSWRKRNQQKSNNSNGVCDLHIVFGDPSPFDRRHRFLPHRKKNRPARRYVAASLRTAVGWYAGTCTAAKSYTGGLANVVCKRWCNNMT